MENASMIRSVWFLLCFASGARVHTQRGVALVQHATSLARTLASTPDHDHMHLVCHRHGCKEIQAALEVVKENTKDAEAKLKECSSTRARLEQDLKKVSQARANVTARLMECAKERNSLQGKVDACAKHRVESERALAKCASDRSALEKELHQCAHIDRPAAEKALAECGVARAKLERELKNLEDKLKKGVSSGRGVRRRRAARRRALLTEINSTIGTMDDKINVDQESDASVQAELVRVREQLSVERRREVDLTARLNSLMEKMRAAQELLDANDEEFEDIVQKLEVNAANGTELIEKMADLAARFDDALAENGKLDTKMSDLNAATKNAIAKEVSAAEELLGSLSLQAEKTNSLLSVVMFERESENTELRIKHRALEKSVASIEEELKRKEDNHEECDDVRATLIKEKAALEKTSKALNACLLAKEIIKKKIDHATKAHETANGALHKCLEYKTKLKVALQDCHDRCKKTGALLKECLDRKKVLSKKIEECHTARDLARTKLKECLDRKDELKEKISDLQDKLQEMGLIESQSMQHHTMTLTMAVHAVIGMMNDVSRAQKKAEAASLTAGIFEGDVEAIEDSIGDAVVAALDATEQQQKEMESALKLVGKMQEVFVSVKSSIDEADISDREVRKEAEALG